MLCFFKKQKFRIYILEFWLFHGILSLHLIFFYYYLDLFVCSLFFVFFFCLFSDVCPASLPLSVASSCMTRLSRSRTTSLSSSYSMEGSRSRSRTLSQSSQGGQLPPSPSHTMEVSCWGAPERGREMDGWKASCDDGRMMTTLSLPSPTRQADDRAL